MARKLAQLIACTAALTALAGGAASAQAATTTACNPGLETQPFLHWADLSQYAQVPGGTFESGLAGWQASPGTSVIADNEPWHTAGAGSRALQLAPGASVQTPSFCGGLGYPTVRLFSRRADRALVSLLQISVLYTDGTGLLRSAPLGVVLPTGTWQPSLQTLTLSGLPLLTGSRLALRITAVGGAFAIDDVYVDPFRRMH